MLCKDSIIKIIKGLDLPLNEYWITSGSALVMHGVKEAANDIDLGCTISLWELKKQKSKLGREKDIRDIKLIDEFIKSRY